MQNTWPTCLSSWCYPEIVPAPLHDESPASPAFYSLNMFHKTESPSISFLILFIDILNLLKNDEIERDSVL